MKVRLSKAAIRDLTNVQKYIETGSPAAALSVISRLEKSIILISEKPLIGRPGQRDDMREWSVPGLPYVIPYRIIDDTVEIVRVYHTARKRPSEW